VGCQAHRPTPQGNQLCCQPPCQPGQAHQLELHIAPAQDMAGMGKHAGLSLPHTPPLLHTGSAGAYSLPACLRLAVCKPHAPQQVGRDEPGLLQTRACSAHPAHPGPPTHQRNRLSAVQPLMRWRPVYWKSAHWSMTPASALPRFSWSLDVQHCGAESVWVAMQLITPQPTAWPPFACAQAGPLARQSWAATYRGVVVGLRHAVQHSDAGRSSGGARAVAGNCVEW